MIRSLLLILVFIVSQLNLTAQSAGSVANGADFTKSNTCGGVERWDVKVLTDAAASQVNFIPRLATLDSLIHITTHPSSTAPRMAGVEFQSYTISCKITIKKNEDDNDYHLVLEDGGQTMIGEVPDPVCSAASASANVNDFIAARNWVNTHIGVNPVPAVNIPGVELTGVSFVDVSHGQTGAAPNQLEIHPILNIQFSGTNGLNETVSPAFAVSVNPVLFSESTTFHLLSANERFENCRLEVYSLSGERVKDLLIPVSNSREINYVFRRDGLAGGMYIYRIRSNEAILYEGKIVIR